VALASRSTRSVGHSDSTNLVDVKRLHARNDGYDRVLMGIHASNTILFLVLVVLGAYYLITALAWQPRSESKDTGRALETLKERYARGEISREQYLKMKEESES